MTSELNTKRSTSTLLMSILLVFSAGCTELEQGGPLPVPGDPTQITPLSGDDQCVEEGQAFPDPVVLLVSDEFGDLTPGIVVSVTPTGGTVDGDAGTQTFMTGDNGTVSFTVAADTLPSDVYSGTVTIEVTAGDSTLSLDRFERTKGAFMLLLSQDERQATCCEDPFGYPITVQALRVCHEPIANLEISYFCGQGHCVPLSSFTGNDGKTSVSIDFNFCGNSDLVVRALDIMTGQVPNSAEMIVRAPTKCCQNSPSTSGLCIPCNTNQPDMNCGT